MALAGKLQVVSMSKVHTRQRTIDMSESITVTPSKHQQ